MNVVLKLPNSVEDKIQAYPMVHTLVKHLKKVVEDKNSEIEDELQHKVLSLHFISDDKTVEVLNLLPFNAYYHEFTEEDFKSVFSIHRAIVNSNLDTADLYISFTNSLVDATIGKNLKAIERVGFSGGKNNFFLSHKVNLLNGRKKSEQFYELLRPLIDDFPESITNVASKEMKEYYLDWRENPYVMINLPVKDDEILDHYSELFDLAEHTNFVLLARDLADEEYAEKMKKYIETLNSKNTYKIFDSKSLIDFAKAVSYCWTFITENHELFQVASYCGAHIHHLYEKDLYPSYGADYFYSEVRQFNLKEDQFKGADGILYNKVFDEIIGFINQKIEETKEQT